MAHLPGSDSCICQSETQTAQPAPQPVALNSGSQVFRIIQLRLAGWVYMTFCSLTCGLQSCVNVMASFLLGRNRLQTYIDTLACAGAHVALSRKSLNPEVSKIWQGLCHRCTHGIVNCAAHCPSRSWCLDVVFKHLSTSTLHSCMNHAHDSVNFTSYRRCPGHVHVSRRPK